MFLGCSNLIVLNLGNFDSTSIITLNGIFNICNDNVIYCIKNTNNQEQQIISYINMYHNFKEYNYYSDICFYKDKKLLFDNINNKYECTLNCNDIYKYEYKNICYKD